VYVASIVSSALCPQSIFILGDEDGKQKEKKKLSDLPMWSIRQNRLPGICPSRFLLGVLGVGGFVSE